MIEDPKLDWRTKALPPHAEARAGPELAELDLSILGGDLLMPVAVIRETALRNNIAEMQAFADRIGALLCPHGKTSMSPELFAMQLEAGAWGMTAATAHHVRVYRRLGIRRILLANQLVAKADSDFVLSEIAADPEFDFYCLVDSEAATDRLAEAARRAACPRPLQVMIETGLPGGRTGLRDPEAALPLARRIAAAAPWLSLRGIEVFEGIRQTAPNARGEAAGMIGVAVSAAEAIAQEGLPGDGPLLLSAGGSAFLDLCAVGLPERLSGRDVQRVIRPGCYVTHDSGLYERITRPGGSPRPGLPDLMPALEVWGAVLSVPEPELAIVGVGKRDISSDVEPPVPLWRAVEGDLASLRPAEGMKVAGMWDQHLSLTVAPGMLRVGDLVGFGISHPCSTFDRWKALFTVDEERRVTGAVTTLF